MKEKSTTISNDLLQKLLDVLESKKIIENIDQDIRFFDEPYLYSYVAALNNQIPEYLNEGYKIETNKVVAAGISSESQEIALIKCLGEAAERFCLHCFHPKDLIFKTSNSVMNRSVNINLFPNAIAIKNKKIGWFKGYDLLGEKEILIPAHLIFLNYENHYSENFIDVPISSGAAGGTEYENTLLTGIYEVIERDAIMTSYLNFLQGYKIKIEKIDSPKIRNLINILERYNLTWHLFDLRVDINVPVFLSVVIDETGLGPAITMGSKANLDIENGIISSLEEALMGRPWLRRIFFNKEESVLKKNYQVKKPLDHSFYWYSIKMLPNLDWLIHQDEMPIRNYPLIENDSKKLKYIKEECQLRNQPLVFADIGLESFKKIGYKVYKVLMPGLQSLYFDESVAKKYINKKRFAKILKKVRIKLNPFPHPFL